MLVRLIVIAVLVWAFWRWVGKPLEERLRSFRGLRVLPRRDDEGT